MRVRGNLQMATEAVGSSMCSFAVTIPPFYFITSAIKQRISRELHKVTVLLSVMGTELQLTAWF